ncbi:MICAL-like protein 1 [Schistocerca piceifrons]|uniref:MICAL-like protein 1 n=1 Tax=Schistocerca piceifrons TaxID=274613 RepID=UPI001F5F3C31|nr:MICAL-like protein 1 [Schistocerca piceifrons]
MDSMDTATETLKTALSAPLPDSDEESSTAAQPRGRSGKNKRRATAATSAVRSSLNEKREKEDFAPDADGFVPARRTARRMQSSTTRPTAVANSFDALADAPEHLLRDPAQKKDSQLPPVVLQYRPPYGELQMVLRSWTTAVYTLKPAGRDLYGVTLCSADDYRRVAQEASERASGAPSAVPTASAAPAPAASEAVPTPEVPAPPPQPLVVEPGTASPLASTGLRPANRRRGGRRPVGTQRSAPSVEQPQVDSHSEAAAPPPSSDGAAPAASTADLASLVAQLTALVTSATKLIAVLSQQLTAAVPTAAPAPDRCRASPAALWQALEGSRSSRGLPTASAPEPANFANFFETKPSTSSLSTKPT